MERFLEAHRNKLRGVLSCFDRLLFKGYLPISYARGMENFMDLNGLLRKDFKPFVQHFSTEIKSHAKAIAQRQRRPYLHLEGPLDKEEHAKAIARQLGVRKGLVCVLAAVETCFSFKLVPAKGRPRLERKRRKCLCLYFYFIDPTWGWMHVRIESWFPFTIQVCLNGHEALACKLRRHKIPFQKRDNAFLHVPDFKRAQRFADRLFGRRFLRTLDLFARRVNPLLRSLLTGLRYYWVTDQAEYASDVIFRSPADLAALYPKLLQHATLRFSAENVMTFLGRKLHGNFAGQLVSRYTKRWPGARIKHQVKKNWIKMYDKFAAVLRVETVINQPREFKIRRAGTRKGKPVIDWFPLLKSVAYLRHYARLARAANGRYLDALASVADPRDQARALRRLAERRHHKQRSYRGFNPAFGPDLRLFAAVLRGEHQLLGLRNKMIRERLFAKPRERQESRRQAAQVTRLLKRLHVHGLLAKIPRTRRWRVTAHGLQLMSASLELHNDFLPTRLRKQKAA